MKAYAYRLQWTNSILEFINKQMYLKEILSSVKRMLIKKKHEEEGCFYALHFTENMSPL